ncbi:S8 family serine peptidase [Catellatospora sp. NPDC049609]|uniref:S8 family serine peptidase n=1 Tax=Catellatospora sp. NPDC049609 TaxID=3155505 RepID=UPI00341B1AED
MVAFVAAALVVPPSPAAAAADKFLPAGQGGIEDAYVVVLAEQPDAEKPVGDDQAVKRVEEAAARLLASHPGKMTAAYYHAFWGFAVTMDAATAQALSKEPDVGYVEQRVEMWFTGEQNVASWGLGAIDNRGGFDPFYRWDADGSGVHAYVIDSGIRASHVEFGGRVSGGVSFIGPPDVSGTGDCHGHGTMMAGVIGGEQHGVAKGVQLHPVRIGGCVGSPDSADYLLAADWIAANAVRPAVVNLSAQTWPNLAVDTATHGLINRGITVVAAAGNAKLNSCDFSPSRLDGVITVGALGPFHVLWDEPEDDAGTSFGVCVDLFAPGSGIQAPYYSSDTADAQASGSSVATAFVTGAVARYLQRLPQASPALAQATLVNEATRDRIVDPQGSPNLMLYTDRDGPGNDGFSATGSDVNGDGRDDVVSFERGANAAVHVALSDGAGFGPAVRWHEHFSAGNEVPLLGDVDGDGRADLITFARGAVATVQVALSIGEAFGPARQWHPWFAAGNEIPVVGDFNGDGRADIATFTRGATGHVYVALSDGAKFGASTLWHDRFAFGAAVPMVGDFDCNGRDDLAAFYRGTNGEVSVAISKGDHFAGGTTWRSGFATGVATPAVGDFDGDGCADIAEFRRGSSGRVLVARSVSGPAPLTWRSFATPTVWHTTFARGVALPGVGDFTGEGRADIVSFSRGYGAKVEVAPSARSFFSASRIWHPLFASGGAVPMPSSTW